MPLAVALSSALRNLNQSLDVLVYVLDGGVDPHDRARCRAIIEASHPKVRLEWLIPNMTRFAGLTASRWHTRAMYLRLLIPELLPREVERVIYMDSDVVVRRDLSALLSAEFAQHAVCAVENFSQLTLATALPHLYDLAGAPPDAPYFNSGVLLINLPAWRHERISERAMTFLRDYPGAVTFGDQDALNVVFAGRWGALDPMWNVQLLTLSAFGHRFCDKVGRERRQAELLQNAAIIHFTGPRKPWHWRYRGLAEHAFFTALLDSGWFSPVRGRIWVCSRLLAHSLYRGLAWMKSGLKGKLR